MAQKSLLFLALSFAVCVSVGYAKAPKKIIDGEPAALGEFPYQVVVFQGRWPQCGGSIISSRHVLTAAQCLFSNHVLSEYPIWVVTGTIHKLKGTRNNVFAVRKFVYHPKFDRTRQNGSYDIAILKVHREIPFNDYQHPINLPTQIPSVGTPAITSGWGAIAVMKGGSMNSTDLLHKLNMTVVSLTECQARFPNNVNSDELCAVGQPTGAPCSGDSGNALEANGEIIGITARGDCRSRGPSVYTSVYSYLAWINETMTNDLA